MALEKVSLEDAVAGLTIPPNRNIKARVIIAGLAFCQFSAGTSRINFLRHLTHETRDTHNLTLTVIKKRRVAGPAHVRTRYESIGQTEILNLSIEDAVLLTSFKGDGPASVEELMNLSDLHDGNLEFKPLVPPLRQTKVLLNDCAFYSFALYRGLQIVDKGTTKPPIRRDFGYIIGGDIQSTKIDAVITLSGNSIPSAGQTLKCKDGGYEYFYEFLFNNHCAAVVDCQASAGGPGATDFHFYYDLFQEKGAPTRQFDLEMIQGVIPAGDSLDDGQSLFPVSIEVAACNPIVTDPPEW